jgi:hypothetical protein
MSTPRTDALLTSDEGYDAEDLVRLCQELERELAQKSVFISEAVSRADEAERQRRMLLDTDLTARTLVEQEKQIMASTAYAEKCAAAFDHIADHGVTFEMDGDMVCATFGDHVDMQETPAGFGHDNKEALRELLRLHFGLDALSIPSVAPDACEWSQCDPAADSQTG